MSTYDTPASLESLHGEQIQTTRLQPSASRRRDKPQLSCNCCRRRKSRCDRKHPCSTCSARGLSCTYAENRIPASRSRSSGVSDSSLHDRLIHLEQLVMRLDPASAGGPASPGTFERGPGLSTPLTTGDAPVDDRSECGSMRVSKSEFCYVGGEHWAAIMDSIADLRDHDRETQQSLADGLDEPEGAGREPNHALLLYGCERAASRAEILAALPPKEAMDGYLAGYFDRVHLVSSVIHRPTFMNQYAQFWADPYSVPIMYLGLLFSMTCLSQLASLSDPAAPYEASQQRRRIDQYREKTVQCLIMGSYTNCGPHVLESMIHYTYIEFGLRPDAHKDVGLLLALEVKLAMRMGYHRDPSHFGNISAFDGEMRRRVWGVILLGDVLISSQMGTPRVISDRQWDTAEPRNLNDEDLDRDTVVLPPSRPEVEVTTALGVIARWRIVVVLGEIADLTASVRPIDHAEVIRLGRKLNEAEGDIPIPLKERDVADTPQLTLARMFIAHLIHKGQLMLHRRFLYSKSNPEGPDTYAQSREACLHASLRTLRMQQVLEEETAQGGRLHVLRWRVTSSMNHQFLTATMVLCSMLHRGVTLNREEEIVDALQRAGEIWGRGRFVSGEALKVAGAVGMVLAGAGVGDGRRQQEDASADAQSDLLHPVDHGVLGIALKRETLVQDNPSQVPDYTRLLTPRDGQDLGFGFDVEGIGSDVGDMTLHEWMLLDSPGRMGI